MKNEVLVSLMNVSIENLAEEQRKALVVHAVSVLENVIQLLKAGEYNTIQKMMIESPSGDCMGTDTHFIDFSYDGQSKSEVDLYDFLKEVISLRDTSKRLWHQK